MRRLIFIPTIALFFSLSGVGMAANSVAPITAARAIHAIHADHFDFPKPEHVDWCSRRKEGTICQIQRSECYDDLAFGPSEIAGVNDVWVRQRSGRISIVIVGRERFVVTAPALCRPPGM